MNPIRLIVSRLTSVAERLRSFVTQLPPWVSALAISATAGASTAIFCVLVYREATRPKPIPVQSEVEE